MIRLILLVGSLLLFCIDTYSQTGIIRGKVTSGAEPVEFAALVIMETTIGTTSGSDGTFIIENIPFGLYEIHTSLMGYEPVVRKLTLSVNEPIAELDIELTETGLFIDEVVISGTMKEMKKLDSPVPVEVYSSSFFIRNPAPSVFESMQNVNGVRPQLNCNVCNTGDIHINGLEGPYTMVLIDGMPIVSGLSTVYGLSGIPQSLIDRVEIVKGPASTLYGSEAVGGLINVITKDPVAAPLVYGDVMSTTWGEVNTDVGVKFRSGDSAVSVLGLNYFNYQNPIDNSDDNFTDVTLQDRISLFNKWSFKRKNGRKFNLAGRYVYEDRWGGEMDWTPDYRGGEDVYGESIFTSRWETFGIYQLPMRENVTLRFSGNGHHHNSAYGNSIYKADQYVGFTQLTWNRYVRMVHDITMGAAFRYTYFDDNTPATSSIGEFDEAVNDPSETSLTGLFIQDEIATGIQTRLLIGMRYDYNSVHGNIFSPRLNFKWNSADRNNTIRFSAGNGYRVANIFTEDHAALTGARDVVFKGDLQPERSWNISMNFVRNLVSNSKVFVNLDASIFYTHFSNRIIADYDTHPNQIIYDNLTGYAVSRGASLNMDINYINGLSVITGLTAMDVYSQEGGSRTRQVLTERFSGIWSIGYRIPRSAVKVDYTGNLFGPMRLPLLGESDPRPEYSPWFSIQNIQATVDLGRGWQLYAGIKNLLNFTPPSNSIARANDPFDKDVTFDTDGQPVATPDNPYAMTFDPSYVFAPNQGARGFLGIRLTIYR